ncbi:MAG: hypothetical protein Q8O56_14740 [Solirubrobacteraceae bacterium]|nr:hypothetical protein [Solirubrobacteraceae bacterium]
MRGHVPRAVPTFIAAVAAVLAAVAPIATASAAAPGGLSINPALLERVARTGPVGAVTVRNTTSSSMRVTVRARPWRQPRSGVVAPDTRRTLARQLRVSPATFTLPAGQRRTVSVRLLRTPPRYSLYGSLEVIGTPPAARRAIRPRYRLIAGVRLNPPAARRVLRVRSGQVRSNGRRTVVALRNAGNTVMPVTGSVRIVGGTGTVRTTIAPARILPGATVDVNLRSGRLLGGRYRATITLRQGGRAIVSTRRSFTVPRAPTRR